MIDLKKDILNLLKSACKSVKVVYSRPKQIKETPIITFVEENNAEMNDYLDEVTINIDVWEETQLKCEELAKLINNSMDSVGFKRINKLTLSEDEMERVNLRYYGVVDRNKTISKGEY